MAQNYGTPTANDTLSDARLKTSDSLDALKTRFSGTAAPSTPAAFDQWVDTTNNWLWVRNPGNTAWVAVGPLDGYGGHVIHISRWVQYTDAASPVTVGYLPAFNIVLNAEVRVTTLFDAAGTDLIDVGYSGDSNAYVAAADVSTTGLKTGAGDVLNSYNATARTVQALYTYTSTAPTAGKALVTVRAIIVPQQP